MNLLYNVYNNLAAFYNIAREEIMKVYIKNKLFSITGKSTVTDASGKPLFDVKGRAFSPTKVKRICTLDGKTLYKVRNKWFRFLFHSAFIFDADKNRIAKIKDRIFSPGYDIEVEGATYSINGKWFSMQSEILKNGVTVGIVRRQFTVIRDAFELEAGEEDMPFMIAFVVAMDNICDRKKA